MTLTGRRITRLVSTITVASMAVGTLALAAAPAAAEQPIGQMHGMPTWMVWWEVHREAYLEQRFGGAPPDRPELGARDQARRDAAIAALLRASHQRQAPRRPTRALAALALGRTRATESVDRLIELTADSNQEVRNAARVALGLLDTPEARAALAQAPEGNRMDTLAWIAAHMMLEQPSDTAIEQFKQWVREPPGQHEQWLSAMALRVHEVDGYADFLRPHVHHTPNPLLANEIVMALGRVGDPEDLELLAQIIDGHGAGGNVRVLELAQSARQGRNVFAFHFQRPILLNAAKLALAQYGEHDVADRRLRQPRRALERQLAAGERFEGRQPVTVLPLPREDGERIRVPLDAQARRGGGLPRLSPIAALALGRIGDDTDRVAVADLLSPQALVARDGFPTELRTARTHPVRGYAALGLALRSDRSKHQPTADRRPQDVERRDQARQRAGQRLQARGHAADAHLRRHIELLGQHLHNRSDYDGYRAACALALGLTGEPVAAEPLIRHIRQWPRNDELVLGYSVLALAMLGDDSAPAAVARFFRQRGEPDMALIQRDADGDDIPVRTFMGARAAALGAAITQDDRLIPHLTRYWSSNRWLNAEIARAIGWAGGYEFSDFLVELLDNHDDRELTFLAVESLVELWDVDRPSRLGRLVRDTNYTLRLSTSHRGGFAPALSDDHIFRPLPALANPLLYNVLLVERW